MLSIEGLTASEILELYNKGKKIHGYMGYFEIPSSKLKDKAKNSDGFPVAPNTDKNIEDFCAVKLSKDGKKAIISVNYSDYTPKHQHLEAFIKKFGAKCLRDSIDPNIYDMEVL